MSQLQTANTIALIRPANFTWNTETNDNAFIQYNANILDEQQKALEEFDRFSHLLQDHGITVLIFNDSSEPHTPDSIFPNNAISTHVDGTLCFYSLKPQNRRLEIIKHKEWMNTLREKFTISKIYDYSFEHEKKIFLEGTGSMVLDRENKICYAAISERTTPQMLCQWEADQGYKVISFHTSHKSSGTEKTSPVYHTNVLMSVGTHFVAICWEVISDKNERKKLRDAFESTKKTTIAITPEQMDHFAGNILEVRNQENEHFIVMSQKAFRSLSLDQKEHLKRKGGNILAPDISTIETVGGGSTRCMMLEIFLPQKNTI